MPHREADRRAADHRAADHRGTPGALRGLGLQRLARGRSRAAGGGPPLAAPASGRPAGAAPSAWTCRMRARSFMSRRVVAASSPPGCPGAPRDGVPPGVDGAPVGAASAAEARLGGGAGHGERPEQPGPLGGAGDAGRLGAGTGVGGDPARRPVRAGRGLPTAGGGRTGRDRAAGETGGARHPGDAPGVAVAVGLLTGPALRGGTVLRRGARGVLAARALRTRHLADPDPADPVPGAPSRRRPCPRPAADRARRPGPGARARPASMPDRPTSGPPSPGSPVPGPRSGFPGRTRRTANSAWTVRTTPTQWTRQERRRSGVGSPAPAYADGRRRRSAGRRPARWPPRTPRPTSPPR